MQRSPSDPATGAAIIGSWEVVVRPDGIEQGFVHLRTFLPGGGLISSVGGQTGHGSWAWTGGDNYALTLIHSDLDEAGQETERSTVMATFTVAADGARVEGPYVNVTTDGAGAETERFAGTVQGVRIRVIPMP